MAVITKTIGTSSRDYSTITLWEADLSNGAIYSSGDEANGEMYNDSAFDEDVVIDGFVSGMTHRTLGPAAGEGHDGTAGSGVRIVRTTDSTGRIIDLHENVANRLNQIELDGNGNWSRGGVGVDTDLDQVITRMIVHGISGSTSNINGLNAGGCIYANCIVYDLEQTHTGGRYVIGIRQGGNTGQACQVRNCTVWNIQNNNGSGSCYAFNMPDGNSNKSSINCIGGGSTGTSSGSISDWDSSSYANAITENNASSDSTANGTGAVTNVVGADAFVSVAVGSEDFHLKSGSALIDAGQDLGTSEVYAVDIDGRNRDTEGDTWDIGAHEFVGGGGNSRYYFAQIAAAVTG